MITRDRKIVGGVHITLLKKQREIIQEVSKLETTQLLDIDSKLQDHIETQHFPDVAIFEMMVDDKLSHLHEPISFKIEGNPEEGNVVGYVGERVTWITPKYSSYDDVLDNINRIILGYTSDFTTQLMFSDVYKIRFASRPNVDGIFWQNYKDEPTDHYSIKIGSDNPDIDGQTGYTYGDVAPYGGVNPLSFRFTMDSSGNRQRGWVWTRYAGQDSEPVMSLSARGRLTLKDSFNMKREQNLYDTEVEYFGNIHYDEYDPLAIGIHSLNVTPFMSIGDWNSSADGHVLTYREAKVGGVGIGQAGLVFEPQSGGTVGVVTAPDITTGTTGIFGPGTYTMDDLNVNSIQFDTTNVPVETPEGLLEWNDDDGTLNLGMPGGEVSLQVGQELIVRVRNVSGSLIPNGSVVMNTGSQGNRPTIELASANSTYPAAQVAITTEDIAYNSNGYVTFIGYIRGLDADGSTVGETWVDGESLYLSPDLGKLGTLTNVKPSAPNHVTWVGVVTDADNSGSIFTKPTIPLCIGDLSDVNGTPPSTTNKHLIWNDVDKYWDAGTSDQIELTTSTYANTGTTVTGDTISTSGTWDFQPDNLAEGYSWNFMEDGTQYKSGIWDHTIFFDDRTNEYHIIGISTVASASTWNTGQHVDLYGATFIHAKTTNFSGGTFEEVGIIDSLGGLRTEDKIIDGQIVSNVWAPHLVEHDNAYYMFYTGVEFPNHVNDGDAMQRIFVAKSYDLTNWEDPEIKYLLDGSASFTVYDNGGAWDGSCRDPFVIWDEAEQEWVMLMTIKPNDGVGFYNEAIGRATSKSLMGDWTLIDYYPCTMGDDDSSGVGDAAESANMFFGEDGNWYLSWTWGTSGGSGSETRFASGATLGDTTGFTHISAMNGMGPATEITKSPYQDNLWICTNTSLPVDDWSSTVCSYALTFDSAIQYTTHQAMSIGYSQLDFVHNRNINDVALGHPLEKQIHLEPHELSTIFDLNYAPISHSSDNTIHFTEGSIDHGSIGGLTDDDHAQYHNDVRAEDWLVTDIHGDIDFNTLTAEGLYFDTGATASISYDTGTTTFTINQDVIVDGSINTVGAITAGNIDASSYSGIRPQHISGGTNYLDTTNIYFGQDGNAQFGVKDHFFFDNSWQEGNGDTQIWFQSTGDTKWSLTVDSASNDDLKWNGSWAPTGAYYRFHNRNVEVALDLEVGVDATVGGTVTADNYYQGLVQLSDMYAPIDKAAKSPIDGDMLVYNNTDSVYDPTSIKDLDLDMGSFI